MSTIHNTAENKKILFATFPGDGHFNPLTGLAVHLRGLGYDVRWYTSKTYTAKLSKLQIPHYTFKTAFDISGGEIAELFPDRQHCRTTVSKLKFDITNVFILRGPEYYHDIKEIYRDFKFDLMIADCAFTGIPFVKDLMQIPVIAVGVFPLCENSKDLAPNGLGITPSKTFAGKIKQAALRFIASKILFRQPDLVLHKMMDGYKISHNKETIFDFLVKKVDVLLQSGTPGFEYFRSDLSKNVKFIGPLLPFTSVKKERPWFDERLRHYNKIILVTQGTVERDVNKLLVPVLQAYKNSDTLVICTTGGSGTEALKKKYPQANIIIEDFIPFADVMPYTGAYITNGGYGGVMLGIENRLPLVVAGVHEGKNEICARVGYFKLGINLKTEKPLPSQIKAAVEKVLSDDSYKKNVEKLAEEFAAYNPNELSAKQVEALLAKNNPAARIRSIVPDEVIF